MLNDNQKNLGAYLGVVAIWSTTPLAIKWSGDTVSPIASVSIRMLAAFIIGAVLSLLLSQKLPIRWRNARLYLAASLGLFPNMLLIYWAAQHIPSGLISVVFASSPFFIGLASIVILKENPFTTIRLLSLASAMAGMTLVFYDQISLGEKALLGLLAVLASTLIFSISSVWVKSVKHDALPFEQTLGAILFSLPGFLLSWYVMDGKLPDNWSQRSLISIAYLASFGSLIGFFAFFHVLQKMSVAAVSILPLLTPVFALLIGAHFAEEVISLNIVAGSMLILASLIVYEGSVFRYFQIALLKPAQLNTQG